MPSFRTSMNSLWTENELHPLDKINGFGVRPGYYDMMGATALSCGVNFTVETKEGTSVELLLFHRKEETPYAVIPFPKEYRIGCVYSMIVFGLVITEFEYAYRVDGPYNPKKGQIFDKEKILLDPYARAVTGQSVWGENTNADHVYKARVVQNDFDWGKQAMPLLPTSDVIIYEMHVRGFTKDASSGVKHPGTFDGIREKIPYIKDLGINAVELMPIFEFDEMNECRIVNGQKLLGYWGYNPISFFAPNTSYSSTVEFNREGNELKEVIKELNENGIEVYLDVVFNHTAEGNEHGPTFSFKGFDNRIYYILTPDGYYYNFSGCGNTFNCNHPIVQKLIRDSLRYWAIEYHISGFRFDLASILGRGQDGAPLANPPILEDLAGDPILSNVKLIAEAWDAGGLYQVGTFPAWKRWAEWNGRYRDDMRDYLKGDISKIECAAARITGSKDIYNPEYRGDDASVNFLNCHDGFTLYDMYAYNEKHNEANGWDNTDGNNDNHSWNCGFEGKTDDPEINKLRKRLCKNAMAALMMSRGMPMIYAGDEFLNSQGGNNNAYCQDTPISWLNWKDLEKNKEHYDFTRFIINFRKKHPVIMHPQKQSLTGFPDVTVIHPNNNTKALGVIYAGADSKGVDDVVGIALNVYWEPQKFTAPKLPPFMGWYIVADTSGTFIGKSSSEANTFSTSMNNTTAFGASSTLETASVAAEPIYFDDSPSPSTPLPAEITIPARSVIIFMAK